MTFPRSHSLPLRVFPVNIFGAGPEPMLGYFQPDCGSDGKTSAYNAGDPNSIPRSGRSSGEGNGNPLQYSCLENPMDGGAW